jgi:hypothetical protein
LKCTVDEYQCTQLYMDSKGGVNTGVFIPRLRNYRSRLFLPPCIMLKVVKQYLSEIIRVFQLSRLIFGSDCFGKRVILFLRAFTSFSQKVKLSMILIIMYLFAQTPIFYIPAYILDDFS